MMKPEHWDAIWLNVDLLAGDHVDQRLTDAAIAVRQGKIAWLGKMTDLPASPETLASKVFQAKGCLVTPGFIDCHTHLVYAGDRSDEFAKRAEGISYETIARSGGGILATVRATREVSEDVLFELSLPRARALQRSGVTTLEIKSGYGLEWETEAKILRVARKIGETLPLTVKRTFLGAHVVPPEYKKNPQAYVDLVCRQMIPDIAETGLADAVDVFCETIAFNLEQTDQILAAAKAHHLDVKCHGEQLSCSGSPEIAARWQALSVDHLEYVSRAGLQAMARAGITAVLLPGAAWFLREKQLPPVSLMRELGLPIALASDCNPGTSPVQSLLAVLNMACLLYGMRPEEAIQGVTCHAARALKCETTHGSLTLGKTADLALWRVRSLAELCYSIGNQPLMTLVKSGQPVANER